jgi:hypothetical protein
MRLRSWVSVALVVLASVAALVAGVSLYAREEIISTPAFVDRASDALGQPTVQRVLSREIAVQLVEPALPDAVAARPLIQAAVRLAIGSSPFQAAFRLAARHGHLLLFARAGGNSVFDIADAGSVITSALRRLAPKVAKEIPAKVDTVLLTLRRRSFAATTLRVADHVRWLGLWLPFVALALFAAAIAAAPDRRRALTRSGFALASAAVVLAVLVELARRYVVGHVLASGELQIADARGAVSELWGAYFDDLMTWTLAFAAGGFVLAAASSSLLAPYSAGTLLRRARALVLGTKSPRGQAARGALAAAIGIFAIVKPTLALRVVGVSGGILLVYFGIGEVLAVTAPARPRGPARLRQPRPRTLLLGVLGAGTLIAGLVVAIVLTGAAASRAAAGGTCNGYAQLCNRRLDEVVFAGTHNAMSAADSPGWYIANQDRAINQQLSDGIRAFKISTHYGTLGQTGLVHTDILAEGDRLNRVAAKLVPSAREALQRLSRSLGRLSGEVGKRDIWLCHTLCELGATQMVGFFQTIRRFLELNPNQVLVFFDEDYVSEQDLQAAFIRAGVFRYLARLTPGQPLPTLGELIRQHHNIVLFAQERTSGRFPWNPYAFDDWIQDTPLGAKKKTEFSCKLYRGHPTNPILMMNNWADIFPPRPGPNVPLVQKDFLLARARQCQQQRGRYPNLILTDYYDRGDVVGAVNTLNGVAGQRLAQVVPVPAQ